MDLIKIGKYIAGKRKELGMTQKELGEKLGMSDKSVSKWEQGICLPDVSLFQDLCLILGISLNELFTGEDIVKDKFVEKAEENLLQISTDTKRQKKKFKFIIGILLLFVVLSITIAGILLWNDKQSDKLETFSKELGIDLTKGYVTAEQEYLDESGKFASAMLRVHFPDNSLVQKLETDDKWHKLPLTGQLQKCWSNDFYFATPLPDVVDGYFFVHDKNWFVRDPYSDSEIFDRSKINVTIAVYKRIYNSLYIYTYYAPNTYKKK